MSPPRHTRQIAVLAWSTALVAIACGQTYGTQEDRSRGKADAGKVPDKGPAPPRDAGEARPDPVPYATAICGHDQRCFPTYITRMFGTVEVCIAKTTDLVRAELDADDSGASSAAVDACIAKLGEACTEDLTWFPECKFKGPRAEGTACSFASQCATANCFKRTSIADCGVCKGQAPAGTSCLDMDCEATLYCTTARNCVVPLTEPAACDDARPCRNDLACISGKCQKLLPIGSQCQVANNACDWNHSCPPKTTGSAQGTCIADPFVPLAQPCGFNSTTQIYTQCVASTCTTEDTVGTCVDYLGENAPCTTDGLPCAYGLGCSGGFCKKADPASCK